MGYSLLRDVLVGSMRPPRNTNDPVTSLLTMAAPARPNQQSRDLIRAYGAFQQTIPVLAPTSDIRDIARFNGNKDAPIHRWFSFKEGFSASLLPWLCHAVPLYPESIRNILDPFCGSGTSLLSAQLHFPCSQPPDLVGVEHNPFIRFVAEAKLSWPHYSPDTIRRLMPKVLAPGRRHKDYPLPSLGTIHDKRAFRRHTIQELMSLRARIDSYARDLAEHDFLLLGWASIIEKVSGLRKDGRALRFRSVYPRASVRNALESQWNLMLTDLVGLSSAAIPSGLARVRVVQGDGRTLPSSAFRGGSFDLIVYSPPYLNNIDYSEVYKLELWLTGMVLDAGQFRELRRRSFRSHPSVAFPETDLVRGLSVQSWPSRLVEAIIHALPEDDDRNWRDKMIRGYADDMYLALRSQFRVARPGGHVVCVVGNSLHGRAPSTVPVATDLLIAALAQEVGFQISALQVGRQLPRRDGQNDLLRESILMMRRP